MLKIYTAPISRLNYRTLQADGATWEDLALLLRDADKTHLLGILYDELPQQFSRSEILRLTFEVKYSSQLLSIAGVSS